MAHYLIAHLNGGRYGNSRLLTKQGIEELHRGVAENNILGIDAGKYGMGWFETELAGMKIYSHSGNVPDFSAFMVIVPAEKKGAILLLGADPYGMPLVTKEIGDGLTALLCGQEPPAARLDSMQWIMRLLPLIPTSQLFGLRRIAREYQREKGGPTGRERPEKKALLPMLPNLGLLGLLIYLQNSGLIRFMDLFMPDLAWIVRVSGIIGGITSLLAIGLIPGLLKRPPRKVYWSNSHPE